LVAAASQLRARGDLPADLRASAGRVQATELFKQALAAAKGLQIHPNKPWPSAEHGEALSASIRACQVYKEVALENADAGLVRDVAPHCPDWSSAVAATEAAAAEAQKLQREVRLLESKWLQPQVERARAVAYAEHQGDPASASRVVEQLDIAGLSNATEEDLLHRAVKVLDSVHEETGKNEGAANNAGSSMHQTQVMHAMVVKDLALACACSKKIVEAAQHMARSLKLSSEVRAHLSADDVEQLRQVAQAVWEHCVRSVRSADTEQGAQDAVNAGTELAAVLVDFNGGSFNI